MSAHLPFELRKFASHCQLLRANFRQTRLASHDLKTSANRFIVADYSPEAASSSSADRLVHSLELREQDEDEVRSIIDAHPGLVVFGSSWSARATIVNELLARTILPLSVDGDPRLIRLQYRSRPTIGTQSDDDESKRIRQELVANCGGGAESELDLRLSHPLLREGWQIFVASECGELRERLRHRRVLPILLYAIEGDRLSALDRRLLEEIRSSWGSSESVFFVRLSVPLSDDELVGATGASSPIPISSSSSRTPMAISSKSAHLGMEQASQLLAMPCSFSESESECGEVDIEEEKSGSGSSGNSRNIAQLSGMGSDFF